MSRSCVAPIFAALVLTLAACGGSAAGTSGGEGGGPESKPEAPQLDVVKPMADVLHVEWTPTTACDTIEAERKDPTHPYAAAFEVAGTSLSHMDGDAFEDMTYTYRIRCKVGSAMSDYSNELSANPTVKTP
jgi:hypothetical protein